MTSSYVESLEHLFALHRHGIKLGLETIAAILARLQHPQFRFLTLHIGGTNGKGSTAAMAASILQAAGYRVGLYTSPHVIDFRERIRVQGRWIPECRVLDIMGRIQRAIPAHASPTFFEFTTAMAFQYFAEEQVEVAVVEVGMGGRFDATNIIDPAGVLITNVGMDHEAYLGPDLTSIAFEKAGVIKAHVPTVLGPMPTEALAVMSAKLEECHSAAARWNREFSLIPEGNGRFAYHGPTSSYSGLSSFLEGAHQQTNAACAIALLEVAMPKRRPVTETAIRSGLSQVKWDGRLETLRRTPWVIVDGAHNPPAASVLADFLRSSQWEGRCRHIILGISMMKDKDHMGFFKELGPLAHSIICIDMDYERSASSASLLDALSKTLGPSSGCTVSCAATPAEGWDAALDMAEEQDLVCFTGSLYLVGEIKHLLENSAHAFSQG